MDCVSPDLPEWLVVGCAVLVCEAILGAYLRAIFAGLRAASGDEEPIPIRLYGPPPP